MKKMLLALVENHTLISAGLRGLGDSEIRPGGDFTSLVDEWTPKLKATLPNGQKLDLSGLTGDRLKRQANGIGRTESTTHRARPTGRCDSTEPHLGAPTGLNNNNHRN